MGELLKQIFKVILVSMITAAFIFYAYNYKINDIKDVKRIEVTMLRLKKIRVALDKYYKKTGSYPNLALEGASKNLKILDVESSKGEIISFAEIYGMNILEAPAAKNKKSENNTVFDISDFKQGTGIGGWNYNYSGNTGEIHANLKEDSYLQGIKWEEE